MEDLQVFIQFGGAQGPCQVGQPTRHTGSSSGVQKYSWGAGEIPQSLLNKCSAQLNYKIWHLKRFGTWKHVLKKRPASNIPPSLPNQAKLLQDVLVEWVRIISKNPWSLNWPRNCNRFRHREMGPTKLWKALGVIRQGCTISINLYFMSKMYVVEPPPSDCSGFHNWDKCLKRTIWAIGWGTWVATSVSQVFVSGLPLSEKQVYDSSCCSTCFKLALAVLLASIACDEHDLATSNDYDSNNCIEIQCKNPVQMPRDLLSWLDILGNFWTCRTLARMSTWRNQGLVKHGPKILQVVCIFIFLYTFMYVHIYIYIFCFLYISYNPNHGPSNSIMLLLICVYMI